MHFELVKLYIRLLQFLKPHLGFLIGAVICMVGSSSLALYARPRWCGPRMRVQRNAARTGVRADGGRAGRGHAAVEGTPGHDRSCSGSEARNFPPPARRGGGAQGYTLPSYVLPQEEALWRDASRNPAAEGIRDRSGECAGLHPTYCAPKYAGLACQHIGDTNRQTSFNCCF